MGSRNTVVAAGVFLFFAITGFLLFGRAGVGKAGLAVRPAVAPRPGVLLVARPQLPDPRFAQAVILLVRHDPSGSVGLIVNRPSDYAVDELVPGLGDAAHRYRIWFGGPVAPYRVSFLIRTGESLSGTEPVLGSLRYGTDTATLEALMARGTSPDDLHVFLGYAGWGPGQLDSELLNGDWILMEGDERDVMAPDGLWERLMERREPAGLLVRKTPPPPPSRRTVSF